MVEIVGIRVLYTGDFSIHETRHLCGAEVPLITPDILVAVSSFRLSHSKSISGVYLWHTSSRRTWTAGTTVVLEISSHPTQAFSFTSMVHEVVSRGGRCLIPVFAVGPAQELMLILDEYWEAHPELSDIPIYCRHFSPLSTHSSALDASALAKKCMSVYQTFSTGMNKSIQKQIEYNNPFVFKHVSNLKVCLQQKTPSTLSLLFRAWNTLKTLDRVLFSPHRECFKMGWVGSCLKNGVQTLRMVV